MFHIHASPQLVSSSNDDVWELSASCRCSHGKQVAGSSHADSAEFSKGESKIKSLLALKVYVSKSNTCLPNTLVALQTL